MMTDKQDKRSPNEVKGTDLLGCLKPIDYCLIVLNVLIRLYCGLCMIISDCDETYNYWEPLNLLSRGFGKQTWEYSPEYAIRSYFYLIPYYLATGPLRDYVNLTGFQVKPYVYFYFIRVFCLCGFTSMTEILLFVSARRNLSLEVSRWYLLVSSVSTGMGHASGALLPSSFAMNWVTLSTSFALFSVNASSTSLGAYYSVLAILSIIVGAIVGWPFTLAIGTSIGLYTLWDKRKHLLRVLTSIVIFTLITGLTIVLVDSFYYQKKVAFVPLNIVLYNVFASESEGPNIFGTEPWTYYIKNLILNFNFLFPAAYAAVFLAMFSKRRQAEKFVCIFIPLWVWTAVFESQEHKEERFLYPIYPLVSLAAAIFYADSLHALESITRGKLLLRLCRALLALVVVIVLALRTISLVDNYSAPLSVARAISETTDWFDDEKIVNVCIGREWYHFPASFFLPDNYRLRFVKSSFDGLLPGDFLEGYPINLVTSRVPSGMNSRNEYSPDFIFDFEKCDLIIDNSSKSNTNVGDPCIWLSDDVLSPDYEVVHCSKMINAAGENSGIGRIIHIPKPLRLFLRHEVDSMNLCLLKRRLQNEHQE